jgi:hypothetical protein
MAIPHTGVTAPAANQRRPGHGSPGTVSSRAHPVTGRTAGVIGEGARPEHSVAVWRPPTAHIRSPFRGSWRRSSTRPRRSMGRRW